jgi:long-chain fatty acid transport protein
MTSRFKYVAVATTLATSLYATNGDNLVGLGAKALGMGGTGIAHYNGSESATSNPALIAKGKGTHITFGGTYFTPDVEVKTANTSGLNDLTATSDAKHNVIPFVTLTENLDNGFAVGASMYGSAGMGTDWRSGNGTIGDPAAHDMGLYSMTSSLMLMKFSLPVAYGQDNWSVGIAPVIMYGALGIAFQTGTTVADTHDIGRGSSNDLGLGYEAGAVYTFKDMGVTVATRYQSPLMMEYKNQISTAAAAFGYGTSVAQGGVAGFSDKLEQPAEIGVGLDWTQGDMSVTADFKQIKWGTAAGYKDFGWENQNVYAIGAEYRMDKLALRAGYNYGKNPIKNNTSTADVTGTNPGTNTDGDTMNAFNHVLFPAVTERHYTIGAGYKFTKNVGADIALMYATSPDVTVSAISVGLGDLTVTNDQKAVAANLNLAF